MKKNIVLTINGSTLIYDFKELNGDEKKYVNKNVISNNTLFYTINYFKKNLDNIIPILISNNNYYDSLTVKNLVTFSYVAYIMQRLRIQYLKLDFPSTLALDDYELFRGVESLKQIDCYYMPSFIEKKFEDKNVIVNLYNYNKVSDRFMLQQDSLDYETLYYRKVLDIKEEYPGLLEDIKEFLRINYNLKTINIYVFSKELIASIIDLVKNDEARDVIVFLHQKNDRGSFITSNFDWLKSLNKTCRNEYKCEFRIVYSNSFIKNNLFKQLTFNNLKLITSLCIYISVVSLIIIKSYEYIDKINIDKLNVDIVNSTYAANNKELEQLEENNADIENDILADIEEEIVANKEKKVTKTREEIIEDMKKKYKFEKVFENLKKINNETIGYLVINNTEISYPVVQHTDNNYYLKHDFYKKSKNVGWIFMDYRNNPKNFDDNTIIYGHYSSGYGIMFGSLKNILTTGWRSNKNNMVFTLDTPDGTKRFKIFAGYKVDYTTDYLVTNFGNEKDFNKFVDLIRGRSNFTTDDEIKYGDKILTLSTCAGGGNRRLVIHAVLLKEEE